MKSLINILSKSAIILSLFFASISAYDCKAQCWVTSAGQGNGSTPTAPAPNLVGPNDGMLVYHTSSYAFTFAYFSTPIPFDTDINIYSYSDQVGGTFQAVFHNDATSSTESIAFTHTVAGTQTFTYTPAIDVNRVTVYQIFGSNPFATIGWDAIGAACSTCSGPPQATVGITPNPCGGNNGTITLFSFDTNAKKVGYSAGSTYSGPGFAAATSITGTSDFVVVNNLPNPTGSQDYTVRVFCDDTNFIDNTLTLIQTNCTDLGVTVTPLTLTNNAGESQQYLITVTNHGPSTAPNATVRVSIPDGRTFQSALPSQGSYDAGLELWTVGNLANGVSATMTWSITVN